MKIHEFITRIQKIGLEAKISASDQVFSGVTHKYIAVQPFDADDYRSGVYDCVIVEGAEVTYPKGEELESYLAALPQKFAARRKLLHDRELKLHGWSNIAVPTLEQAVA